MMMFFRAESLLTWGEFVRVNRATDDDENPDAQRAADDMDQLAITSDGRAGAARVRFDLDLPSAAVDDLPLGPGLTLPEWDFKARRLRPDHCAVQTYVARDAPAFVPTPALARTARRVQRRMELLRSAPRWQRAQPDGDELDLDAWVRQVPEGRRDESPPVFARRVRDERSLATLLLADLSLSTDAHLNASQRVIDVVRDAMQVFGEALAASGDAFEMLGFSSVRRQHVRIQQLKTFDEPFGARVRSRIAAIKPGYYTRMGAALRLATRHLGMRPERQRLLLLLTDGKPNDLDVYEGRYGLEDTREAVREARRAGLTPFAVSIDEQAQHYLPHLFGAQGFVQLRRPADLPLALARLWVRLARRS
jgi:nitric oxide reductase NorD protein